MKTLVITGAFVGYALMTIFVLGLCRAAATSENPPQKIYPDTYPKVVASDSEDHDLFRKVDDAAS